MGELILIQKNGELNLNSKNPNSNESRASAGASLRRCSEYFSR